MHERRTTLHELNTRRVLLRETSGIWTEGVTEQPKVVYFQLRLIDKVVTEAEGSGRG